MKPGELARVDIPSASVSALPLYTMSQRNPEVAMLFAGDVGVLIACAQLDPLMIDQKLCLIVCGSIAGWIRSDALKPVE